MARILVVGTGPLLGPGARIVSGQCLRTTHFLLPLAAAGHELRLVTVPIPGTLGDGMPVEGTIEGIPHLELKFNDEYRAGEVIRQTIADFHPEGIVGVNAWPAYLVARQTQPLGDSPIPFWADLNGWTMTEGQVRAARLGHEEDYGHFWRMETATLLTAGAFSTVSRRQADALIGELAMLGRLTRDSAGGDFVADIPNAIQPVYSDLIRTNKLPEILRDKMPENSRLCLWSGGFNSWTNIDFLVKTLKIAMDRVAELHVVFTGGKIIGHDEKTYELFEQKLTELDQERIHLLGWVDFDDVVALHARADLAINVDGRNLETRFGARNRLTNMLGAGLPVVTTRGTEIAEWIERNEAGIVTDDDDAVAYADGMVRLCADNVARESLGQRARALAKRDFDSAHTVARMLEWAAAPRALLAPPPPSSPPARIAQAMGVEAAREYPFRASEETSDGAADSTGRISKFIKKVRRVLD